MNRGRPRSADWNGFQPMEKQTGKILAACLTGVILFGAAAGIIHTGCQEGKMDEAIFLNTKIYGDTQNTSYLDVAKKLKGTKAWEQETVLGKNPMPPRTIALTKTHLIISYGPVFDVRDRMSGRPLWHREVFSNYAFDLKKEGLVTLDQAGYYEIINLEGHPSKKLSLPFLGSKTFLFMSQRLDGSMIYSYQTSPSPVSEPGQKAQGPFWTFIRLNVEPRNIEWEFVGQGFALDALLDKSLSFVCIPRTTEIYLLDPKANSEAGVRIVPFEEVVSCALDHQGNVLLVEHQEYREDREERFILKMIRRNGSPGWEVSLGRAALTGQPPASHPDGTVYIMEKNELLCFKEGKEIWNHGLFAEPGKAWITVLKDGSALVAAGVFFYHISRQGKELCKVQFDDPVTCRPVMDESGRVYMAGVRKIFCIQ